jgi:hypothetical protein
MKRFLLCVVALTATILSAKAQNISFAYDAGAEVVSSYIWRGQYNGGLSFQPTASVGFDALDENIKFRAGAWGSLGASDWKFRFNFQPDPMNPIDVDVNPNTYFIPEVDLFATISAYGFWAGVTHYYYFGGTPFFAGLEDDGGSQTEVSFGFNLGDVVEKIGLYVNWNTMVAGNDAYYTEETGETGVVEEVAHRAWSTYFEVGYNQPLPFGMTIGAAVGMSPWRSLYTDYQEGFAVNNIQLRLSKTWELGDLCELELYGLGTLNTYGLTKENLLIWEAGDLKLYKQRLNGCIGLGVWF